MSPRPTIKKRVLCTWSLLSCCWYFVVILLAKRPVRVYATFALLALVIFLHSLPPNTTLSLTSAHSSAAPLAQLVAGTLHHCWHFLLWAFPTSVGQSLCCWWSAATMKFLCPNTIFVNYFAAIVTAALVISKCRVRLMEPSEQTLMKVIRTVRSTICDNRPSGLLPVWCLHEPIPRCFVSWRADNTTRRGNQSVRQSSTIHWWTCVWDLYCLPDTEEWEGWGSGLF